MQVITPALAPGARLAAQYGSTSARGLAANSNQLERLGKFAGSQHWSSTASLLNGKVGTGVLTFAPSAALDVYNSFEQDLRGDSRFSWQKFGVASAKSQSGNLLGAAGGVFLSAGVGVAAVAITGVALTAAPLIVIGLIGGVAIQVVWGTYGGSDWASTTAQRALIR